MSDEFIEDGRSFKDGDDPVWTVIENQIDDQTAQGRTTLQFYDSSIAFTENEYLVPTQKIHHGKDGIHIWKKLKLLPGISNLA